MGVLPPGEYQILLSQHKFVSSPQKIKVTPFGWRKDFSDFLLKEICHGQILDQFKDYLDIQKDMATVDMDHGALGAFQTRSFKALRRAILPYSLQIKNEWRVGLSTQSKVDSSIPEHVKILISQSCPADKNESSDIVYIFGGIRDFYRLTKK